MKNLSRVALMLLIAAPVAYAYHLYPYLPETIPTHFNAKGEPDAFSGRNSIFIAPAIMAGTSLLIYLLLANIAKIDPKRHQKTDNDLYRQFALFMVTFLTAISMVILYITSHPGTSFARLLLPVMGVFFAGMGLFMPRFHQNYFAGLRLPWTLDNEANWIATHKMAGKVWLAGGLLMAATGFITDQQVAFVVFMTILVIMVLIPIVFSYRMFARGNKSKDE